MRKPISWDKLWMGMAKLVEKRSKDPNTQVGAVLVSPDNKRVAVGYNGFPSGALETTELWGQDHKYTRVVHAEVNALIHADTDTTGWTLYVTKISCSRCAPIVCGAGIKRVVYNELLNERSKTEYKPSFDVFQENGVIVEHFSEDCID